MSAQNGTEKRPLDLEDARELLPWYLTGRVSRDDAKAIEAMLKDSAELRLQLDAAKQEREAVVAGAQSVGAPSAENLTRLLQQIETTKQRRFIAAAEPGLLERWLGSWFAPRAMLKFALATACVVIVAQGALLYRAETLPAPSPSETYATAGADTVATIDVTGAELVIALRPDVTTAQFVQILTELDAVVIDGPKPGLTFVIRLQADSSANEAIARLQSRPDLIARAQRR